MVKPHLPDLLAPPACPNQYGTGFVCVINLHFKRTEKLVAQDNHLLVQRGWRGFKFREAESIRCTTHMFHIPLHFKRNGTCNLEGFYTNKVIKGRSLSWHSKVTESVEIHRHCLFFRLTFKHQHTFITCQCQLYNKEQRVVHLGIIIGKCSLILFKEMQHQVLFVVYPTLYCEGT